MNSERQPIFLLLCVVTLGFLGWLSVKQDHASTKNTSTHTHLPDIIMHHVTVTQFDEQGQLHSRLHSPKVTHYPHDNHSIMKHPNVQLFHDTQPPWRIDADHGLSTQGLDKLTLTDHVRISQSAGPHNRASELLTEKLIYLPKKQYAYTDKKVIMHQAGRVVTALGLTAELDKQHVQLLHNIKVRFMPKS